MILLFMNFYCTPFLESFFTQFSCKLLALMILAAVGGYICEFSWIFKNLYWFLQNLSARLFQDVSTLPGYDDWVISGTVLLVYGSVSTTLQALLGSSLLIFSSCLSSSSLIEGAQAIFTALSLVEVSSLLKIHLQENF